MTIDLIPPLLAAVCLTFLMVRYISLSRRIDRHQEAFHRMADLLLILQKQDIELLQTIRLVTLSPSTQQTDDNEQDNDIQ